MHKQKLKQKNAQLVRQLKRSVAATSPNITTPQEHDEASVSGHMPDVDADNDVSAVAKEVGLYTEADSENPAELNVAKEVAEAERARRGIS